MGARRSPPLKDLAEDDELRAHDLELPDLHPPAPFVELVSDVEMSELDGMGQAGLDGVGLAAPGDHLVLDSPHRDGLQRRHRLFTRRARRHPSLLLSSPPSGGRTRSTTIRGPAEASPA